MKTRIPLLTSGVVPRWGRKYMSSYIRNIGGTGGAYVIGKIK